MQVSCQLHMHIPEMLPSHLECWPVEAKGGSLDAHGAILGIGI